MQRLTRGLRRIFIAFTVVSPAMKTKVSPSRSNHMGITCGRPSARTVPRLAVRARSSRKLRYSSAVISCIARSSYRSKRLCLYVVWPRTNRLFSQCRTIYSQVVVETAGRVSSIEEFAQDYNGHEHALGVTQLSEDGLVPGQQGYDDVRVEKDPTIHPGLSSHSPLRWRGTSFADLPPRWHRRSGEGPYPPPRQETARATGRNRGRDAVGLRTDPRAVPVSAL